ncbi:ABC transporter ATP-binding protein [Rhodovibrionaceae bacterium A322]
MTDPKKPDQSPTQPDRTAGTSPLLQLDRVCKRYGSAEVVQSVSLSLAKGERLALLGHNGAGKTTLIKLILGLITPSAGNLQLDGVSPQSPDFHLTRQLIGYLPEQLQFQASLTGRELLSFYARLKQVETEGLQELLEKVELAFAADRRIGTYSKGMRQRLGLAQAILGAPKLLLLDEPMTGLDPALRQTFFTLLDDLKAKGVAALISSHALTEIEARVDRLAIMNQGRLVAFGSLDDLRRQAGLSTRITVSVPRGQASELAQKLSPLATPVYVNDQHLDLACLETGKMALLREITQSLPQVTDLQIAPPRLEEIYAHFMTQTQPEKESRHG